METRHGTGEVNGKKSTLTNTSHHQLLETKLVRLHVAPAVGGISRLTACTCLMGRLEGCRRRDLMGVTGPRDASLALLLDVYEAPRKRKTGINCCLE
ncbi:hypothetical protein E2C01_097623 [Portunus trituberculatus]|uniref:Uncharacterized protein n=1 Tax=Portunus trituberculatus TaxID=210409 RepID=A0A5B7KA43_PORTR|nr:hypothetical protein [Portunus trituberculatus]